MKIFTWNDILTSLNTGKTIDYFENINTGISVGSFDGIHKGHSKLLNSLIENCKQNNLLSGVVTFKRPLPSIKHSDDYSGDITSLSQRIEIFEKLGIDFAIVVDFDDSFASMLGTDFLNLLINVCNMSLIAEGIDFRCGYKGSTDTQAIKYFAEKNDIKAAIPESLSTGYTFSNSNTGGMKGEDDNGNPVAKGETFMVTYSKEGAPDLYLNVDPIFQAEDYSDATEVREINGVTVYYNKDTYKFVPTDYEYSEEDKANEEAGHFYVSYGSDEVKVQSVDSILFELDGKSYDLLSFDNSMSVDEWFAMAEEIIE